MRLQKWNDNGTFEKKILIPGKNVHDLKNARRKVAIHFVQKVGIGKVKLHFDFF